MSEFNAPHEIRLVRLYDAPVQAVWEAWSDPAQLAQWWGPRGFSLTTHSKDLRVGGHWHYTMHGPDGTDYPNRTVYHEVEALRKLVYDHGANEQQPPLFRVTVLFSSVDGGKTQMDMTMALADAASATQTRAFIKSANGDSTWDRLAEYLAVRLTGEEKFVINRSFEVPREVLFAMWTQPDQLLRWLAPGGMAMRYLRADIRSGGSAWSCMSNGGFSMYGRAQYQLIEAPTRMVYTQQFCDEHENITRHPMAPLWPESMRTTVEFHVETEHRTRLTLSWQVDGSVTAEELAVFTGNRAGMMQGWSGSFDQLEAALA